MVKMTNPLDTVKIASPCGANWDEMNGDKRRRFCSRCNLNVYNLSEMTRLEAENFLINSEGRVCLKIYRRADGSVLTQNCPVGLQKLKRKVSRAAAIIFGLLSAYSIGIFGVRTAAKIQEWINYEESVESTNGGAVSFGLYGILENLPQIKSEIIKSRKF